MGNRMPAGRYRPRETRSISTLTMRSTSPGKLSSSHDFSIGRSISRTMPSSDEALLPRTVSASALKADSTADIVEFDRIGGCAVSKEDGSNTGGRFTGSAGPVVAENSRSSSGSAVRRKGCDAGGGAGGTGIASTGVAGTGSGTGSSSARISLGEVALFSKVALSRLASNASKSRSFAAVGAGAIGFGDRGSGAAITSIVLGGAARHGATLSAATGLAAGAAGVGRGDSAAAGAGLGGSTTVGTGALSALGGLV